MSLKASALFFLTFSAELVRGSGPTEPESPKKRKSNEKVTLGVDPKVTKKQLKVTKK